MRCLYTREELIKKHSDASATFESDNYLVFVIQDDEAESPREWDNVGTMVCCHRNYNLGDTQVRSWDENYTHIANELGIYLESFNEEEDCWEEKSIEQLLGEIREKAVILPLYLYDHSGITMNTGGFNDPWDSGRVGHIFVSFKRAYEEYGDLSGDVNNPDIPNIEKHLRGEVKTYANYLEGKVYGFIAYKKIEHNCDNLCCKYCDGYEYEEYESVWGFIANDLEEVAKEGIPSEEYSSLKEV